MIRASEVARRGRRDAWTDTIAALTIIVIGALCLVGDLAAAIAAWIVGRGFRWLPLRVVPRAAAALVLRFWMAGSTSVATPRGGSGGPGWLVGADFVGILAVGAAGAILYRRVRARAGVARRREPGPATWATRRLILTLLVRATCPGRLVIGRFGRSLVATETRHSLLVIGPTQSGKTTGLVIPALLEWDGPVVAATSVKRDLLDATIGRRRQLGEVAVYDPTAVSGASCASWNPLDATRDWAGAKRVAANLCGVAQSGAGNLEDGGFWYSTAEKLLAPLLFAAANTGREMADVVRWVDLRMTEEPIAALVDLDASLAWQAAVASFDRDDRQLSSVYATVESVLGSFAHPGVLVTSGSGGIDPVGFFESPSSTLYLVAPARAQERLAPVFVALLGELFEAAFERPSTSANGPDQRLLVVLDEAANIAPVRDLDVLASTAASHGIQLVTVFQDVAQIDARYGAKAATVVNNHRARLLCSGVVDPKTLGEMSTLIGEAAHVVHSTSASEGQTTMTWADERRPLATSDALRRIEPGDGVLIYGHLPPVRLRLRPWFANARLRRLAVGSTDPPGPSSRRRKWHPERLRRWKVSQR